MKVVVVGGGKVGQLLTQLLVEEDHDVVVEHEGVCKNARCITNSEDETMPIFVKGDNGRVRCKFCDQYVD